ncbi:MAG: chemotaxis protein CheD [Desulfovibrionaceae bacterium]
MTDAALPRAFLGIAEGKVCSRPMQVQTLLGSCVAVTLHCRALRCGSIFHALLPVAEEYARDPERRRREIYRYVDTAVRATLDAMCGLGARRATLEAKVFGGACALVDERVGVGLKNVRTAFEALNAAGVRVAASNVGGDRGRKILYYPHTGEVFVKMLAKPPASAGSGEGPIAI